MNLDLLRVINGLKNQMEYQFEIELEESYLASIGSVECSPFTVSGMIRKIDGRYDLNLTYSGDMVFECHRCLQHVKISLKNSVERILVTAQDPDEDINTILLEGSVLNLLPILEEEITLNVPTHVVCDEGCKGLCPKCGTDLNQKTCTCDVTKGDPRLEALKHLFT